MKINNYKLLTGLVLTAVILFTGVISSNAQTNLALTATTSGQGSGTITPHLWNWNRINDNSIPSCGPQEAFIWTDWGGPTGVEWMEWAWTAKKGINKITIHHAHNNRRSLTGGTVQYWDGTKFVDHHTFTIPQQCKNEITFQFVFTNKIRIAKWKAQGLNQQSNMNYREIEIWEGAPPIPDNASISGLQSPADVCDYSQDITVELSNHGLKRIDSVDIQWSINGVAQNVFKYNSGTSYQLSDTIGSGDSKNVVLVSNYTFSANTQYDFKIWSTMPNGKADTFNLDDTLEKTINFIGSPNAPTTYNTEQCGVGYPTLHSTNGSGITSIWFDPSNLERVLGIGDTATLTEKYDPEKTYKFYARSMSENLDTVKSDFTEQWSFTGGASPTDKGYYWDVLTKTDVVIGGIEAYLTAPSAVGPKIVHLYYKTGSHVGSESNSGAWTLWDSALITPTSNGSSNSVFIDLPGLFLRNNSAYAFNLMVKDVAQDFRTNCAQTSTARDYKGMQIIAGKLYTGAWSSVASQGGFIPELQFEYLYGCGSDTIPVDHFVKAVPIGASADEGATFEGTYNSGISNNPDIVAESDEITYELIPPTGYNSSDYDVTWTSEIFFETLNGTQIYTSDTSVTYPSGSGNGLISYTPHDDFTDSVILMQIVISDLGPNFCDSIVERYIRVAPRGKPNFSVPTPICDGDNVAFTNLSTVSSGQLTYKWYFDDGDSSELTNPVHLYKTSGDYKVRLVVTTSPYGYVTDTTITITITEVPQADFIRTNACEGEKIGLTNTTQFGGTGTVTYEWDFGDPSFGMLPHSTNKDEQVIYPAPNGYRVTLKATANGCSDEISRNVYQFATPKADFTAPSGSQCTNTEIQFTNNSTIANGVAGSSWFLGDGNVSTDRNPKHTYKSVNTFSVTLIMESEFGCKDSVKHDVVTKEGPTADFSFDQACSEEQTTFTFTGSASTPQNPQYSWDIEGQTFAGTPVSHSWANLGPQTVKMTVTLANGCSDEISKDLDVLVQPQVSFNVADVCDGEPVIFENTTWASSGRMNYNWDFGDNNNSTDADPKHVYNTNNTTTTYTVTLEANLEGGCSGVTTKQVTVNANPVCGFTIKEDYLPGHRTFVFDADEDIYPFYRWTFGDGGSSQAANPTYQYLNDGNYTVTLTARNSAGCECTSTQTNRFENVGTSETTLQGVNVYPNPTSGVVSMDLPVLQDDFNVEVVNVLGDVIYSGNVDGNAGEFTFDISGNAAGIYLVKISNNEQFKSVKLTLTN
jgi:PKD repeat protein